MEDYIYFYIPGLVGHFDTNFVLLQRMKEHPDHFYPNIKIGAIFGCPPGALWNGGRYSDGHISDSNLRKMVEIMDAMKVPIRYTWTNPTLTKEDLKDEYCNMVTKLSENGRNEILVNNDLMEKYIRKNYPAYPIISSTTKRITSIKDLNKELKKDYKLVVIDYDFNNDWDMLSQIKYPEKCEILINALCNPHCPFRKLHYQQIGLLQKGELDKADERVEKCTAQNRLMNEIKQLPTFVSREDIWEKYVPNGFRHFKIEGRCACPLKTIEWYLYYMVKPEHWDEERGWLHTAYETTIKEPNIPFEKNNN